MPRFVKANADAQDRLSRLTKGAVSKAALLSTLLAVLALLTWVDAGKSSPQGVAWLLTLGVVIIAITVAGAWRRQSELQSLLHDARLEAQGLADLLDASLWRSDARHCVTLMRPPNGSRALAWSEVAVGQPLWEYYAGDNVAAAALRARVMAHAPLEGLRVWRASAPGERTLFELRGGVRHDAQGRFIGYLGSARALNDEEALRSDQRILALLLATLPVPVFVLDGSDDGRPDKVQRANAAAARLLGLQPLQLDGMPLADLQTRMSAGLRASMTRALSLKEGGSERLATHGWELQVHRVDAPIEADERREASPTSWVLTLVQTPRYDTAAEVAGADHESFGYSVSHDLRAPLRVVDGFTKILKEDYGRLLDRVGNDHLDRVLGAVARMNNMIDALLTLSQLSARPLARQPVNLSQLAAYITDDLRRQSPERNVTVHVDAELRAHGDPTLLRIALENLLENAWKYSAKKSDAQIWLECSRAGPPVFTVRDNGVGFDMRFADRLFGVFQRLHSANEFPGTGVGLATVRRVINRHGGEIWATSEVDRGSSFHFTLPSDEGA